MVSIINFGDQVPFVDPYPMTLGCNIVQIIHITNCAGTYIKSCLSEPVTIGVKYRWGIERERDRERSTPTFSG